ncbi:RluA family pseudouridine synthase [Syntrophomonas erecta]
MKKVTLLVPEEAEGDRLDIFVAESREDLSRSMVKDIITSGKLSVDGQVKKPGYRVKEGEEISVEIPQPSAVSLEPQPIPLTIIYQDKDLAVINKPKGLVVHPAHGNWDNTLVNALLYHIRDLSGINGEIRPGIVHRLDKDTSGVMVVAKNDYAHRHLARQIKDHSVNREYIALVHGTIQENVGTVDAPIGRSRQDRKKMAVVPEGRSAISHYQVMDRFSQYTLVKIKLMTGRTHQIRVHFSYIGHPVVGDPLYGPHKQHLGFTSQALHAHLLGFEHPTAGKYMEFRSDLPIEMSCILNKLKISD